MIYTENLEQMILSRHVENGADELLILSGWSGASPVQKISRIGIRSTVIHGIKRGLNAQLLSKYQQISSSTNTEIYVSSAYNHSKIYCWMRGRLPVDILTGSANLSTEGLNSKIKGETLFDVEKSDYLATLRYLNDVLDQCDHSSSVIIGDKSVSSSVTTVTEPKLDRVLSIDPPKAEIYLGGEGRKLQNAAGLNWGHGSGHNARDCAELRLRTDLINAVPALFPNSGVNLNLGAGQAHKNKKPNAEFLFDDGEVMDISFEGLGGKSIVSPDQQTFKQCSSFPKKNILGRYIRRRLGLSPDAFITDSDLTRYGRDTITLEMISPGVYYCDFSVPAMPSGV